MFPKNQDALLSENCHNLKTEDSNSELKKVRKALTPTNILSYSKVKNNGLNLQTTTN